MLKFLNFFDNKEFQPVITHTQVENIQNIIDSINKNNVQLLWSQVGSKKRYYYFKQYRFSGVNLYNILIYPMKIHILIHLTSILVD
jgi:hypothetical protein